MLIYSGDSNVKADFEMTFVVAFRFYAYTLQSTREHTEGLCPVEEFPVSGCSLKIGDNCCRHVPIPPSAASVLFDILCVPG